MELDKGRDRRGKKLLRDKEKKQASKKGNKKPRMEPYGKSQRRIKIYEDND